MAKEHLENIVRHALEQVFQAHGIPTDSMPPIVLERPRDRSHGDWATNVAMTSAGALRCAPRDIATEVLEYLTEPEFIDAAELAGPGFINFRLTERWLYDALAEARSLQERYGHRPAGTGLKVQVEFVSANPVGPMHVGHGRWAALGDCLSRVMEAMGDEVDREFYVNDYGNQMALFGLSVAARYREALGREVRFPDDGYQGHYIKEIAAEIIAVDGDKYLEMTDSEQAGIFTELAYKQVIEHLKKTLGDMEVVFDSWFSERSLHDSGALAEALDKLEAEGWAYRKDGALWLRTSSLGDDKDRVMVREDGRPTYFAADIAYHRTKLDRGYDKVINIWGADHHGYVARMKAACRALGAPDDWLEIIIGQLVSLYRGGTMVRMSKRTGEMVTLEELLTEVGRDASRYFFLMRSTDTALDFDIDLAKSKTNENPVYYVQYAHARIASIVALAEERGVSMGEDDVDLTLLTSDPELNLIREIAKCPSVIERTAQLRAPHTLTQYAESLAANFHHFYHKCRVVTDDAALSTARLALVEATQYTLRNVLNLLGVSAPESM